MNINKVGVGWLPSELSEGVLGKPVEPGLDRSRAELGVGVADDGPARLADAGVVGDLQGGAAHELGGAADRLAAANRATDAANAGLRQHEGPCDRACGLEI